MPADPETPLDQFLYSSCTLLDVGDLDGETECWSCSGNFGWKDGSEVPLRLRCGHVYGLSCLKAIVRSHAALGQSFPRCPTCRVDFLNVGPDADLTPFQLPVVSSQQRPAVPSQRRTNHRRTETPSQRRAEAPNQRRSSHRRTEVPSLRRAEVPIQGRPSQRRAEAQIERSNSESVNRRPVQASNERNTR